MQWLLFLSQLPTKPSSLRVMVWRKMKAAGALGIQNGVWMLPDRPEPSEFARRLLSDVQRQGAGGHIFTVQALDENIEQDILARFRRDRNEEYDEFCERCRDMLAEIDKETAVEKFTFAELEEAEQDLHKLEKWHTKIQQRDFVAAEKAGEAAAMLAAAATALERFAVQVYIRQGIDVNDTCAANDPEDGHDE